VSEATVPIANTPPQDDTPVVVDGPVMPWQRRREIGRFRAYWRTVFHVFRRNGRIGEMMAGPVDFQSGVEFRKSTVSQVMLALVIRTILVLTTVSLDLPMNLVAMLAAVVLLLLMWPALSLMTSLPALACTSRACDAETEDRAVALSLYNCAPLALVLPIVLLVSLPEFLWNIYAAEQAHPLLQVRLSGLLALALGVYWWFVTGRAIQSVSPRRPMRIVLTWIALPLLWVCVYLVITFLPAVIAMWGLMFLSVS